MSDFPIGRSPRRLTYGGVPYVSGEIEYPCVINNTSFLADFPWHSSEGLVTVNAEFKPSKFELRRILQGHKPSVSFDMEARDDE